MGSDKSNYLIEALEPRILLSGDGIYLSVGVLSEQPTNLFPEVEEYSLHNQAALVEQDHHYHPEAELEDLFEDMEETSCQDPDDQAGESETTMHPINETPAPLPICPIDNEAKLPAINPEHNCDFVSVNLFTSVNSQEKNDTLSDELIPSAARPKTDILVETLNAANPPPVSEGALFVIAVESGANEPTLQVNVNNNLDNNVNKNDGIHHTSESVRQIAFIDPSIEEYESLIDGLLASDSSGLEVVILDHHQDGLEQISEVLAGYQNISAVHIFSHGASGMLRLGDSRIGINTLKQNVSELKSWDEALTPEADILLYGCNVAQGETGIQFVQSLSRIIGADVAASSNNTGPVTLGGDWALEVRTGLIETPTLFPASTIFPASIIIYTPNIYTHLLGDITGTDGNDTLTSTSQNDTLTGLKGNDIYKFSNNWGVDTVIEQKNEGTDILDFSQVTVDLTITVKKSGEVLIGVV